MTRTGWRVTLAAAALAAIAMGGRNVFGVFVSPLNTASGMGLAIISLAMALGQLGAGIAQPLVGQWADRSGATRVILVGSVVLAVSMAVPALWMDPVAVFIALLVSGIAASAVGSNGLLLGVVSRAAAARNAGLAVGLVGAGTSLGQMVLGPALQQLSQAYGWQAAMLVLAGLSLAALPLAFGMREDRPAPAAPARGREPVGDVLREWTFWRYALSFTACGVHISFLGAHAPGAIERCGFAPELAGIWIGIAGAANIAGSVAVGLFMKRFDTGRLLAAIYVVRASSILLFVLLPYSVPVLMAFALLMGASHMATLPPTAALVAERYGTARLGTLFGVVMLLHQVGAFVGIWLGGWLAQATGKDEVFWTIDIMLALVAAALVMPPRTWDRLRHFFSGAPFATPVATRPRP